MKKIIEFLKQSGMEYSVNKYGNPYYFSDNFSVDGIQVSFYFDGIGNSKSQEKVLIDFMKHKKTYEMKCERFGAGYTYRIMTVFDSARLEKHENAIKEAHERFWQEEHARRMRIAI